MYVCKLKVLLTKHLKSNYVFSCLGACIRTKTVVTSGLFAQVLSPLKCLSAFKTIKQNAAISSMFATCSITLTLTGKIQWHLWLKYPRRNVPAPYADYLSWTNFYGFYSFVNCLGIVRFVTGSKTNMRIAYTFWGYNKAVSFGINSLII